MRQDRQTLSRLVLLSLCTCFLFCCYALLKPSSAYADEEPEPLLITELDGIETTSSVDEIERLTGVEELDNDEALEFEPTGYQVMRVSDGLVLAYTDGESVSIRTVETEGDDGGFNPFEEVWNTIIGNSVSAGMANDEIALDLAWRWFHADASLKDKEPLVPIGANTKRLSDFTSYEEFYSEYRRELFFKPWDLKGFDSNTSWQSDSPQAEYEYEKWYNYFTGQGDDSGGGGGGGNTSVPTTFIMTAKYADIKSTGSYSYRCQFGGVSSTFSTLDTSYLLVSKTITVNISQEAAEAIEAERNGMDVVAVLTSTGGTSTNTPGFQLRFYYMESGSYVINTDNFSNRQQAGILANFSGVVYGKSINNVTLGNTVTLSQTQLGSTSYTATSGAYFIIDRAYYAVIVGGGGGTEPEPQEPVYPTPPEPDNPLPPEPQPQPGDPSWTITINNTTNNTTNNETTSTTTDLDPILRAIRIVNSNIINETNLLHSDIETCCANMRAMLEAYLQTIIDWLEYIANQVDAIGTAIYEFDQLILDELRMANGWLRGIFYKLGSGNAGKPDITIDTDGAHSWLDDVLEKLLGSLPEGILDLLAILSPLKTLFPFCIPWDIVALMELVARDPITPVFDLPWPYAMSGGSVVYASCHVDCTPWNGYAAACRMMWRALFAYYLAWATKYIIRAVEIES